MKTPFTYYDAEKVLSTVYDRTKAIELPATLGSNEISLVFVIADSVEEVLPASKRAEYALAATQAGMKKEMIESFLLNFQPIETTLDIGLRHQQDPVLIIESRNIRKPDLNERSYVLNNNTVGTITGDLIKLNPILADQSRISPFLDMITFLNPLNDITSIVNLKREALASPLHAFRHGMTYVEMQYAPGDKFWGYMVPSRFPISHLRLACNPDANNPAGVRTMAVGTAVPAALDVSGNGVTKVTTEDALKFSYDALTATSPYIDLVVDVLMKTGSKAFSYYFSSVTQVSVQEDAMLNGMDETTFRTHLAEYFSTISGTDINSIAKKKIFFIPNMEYLKRFQFTGTLLADKKLQLICSKNALDTAMLGDLLNAIELDDRYVNLKTATKTRLQNAKSVAYGAAELLFTSYDSPCPTTFALSELSMATQMTLAQVAEVIVNPSSRRKVKDIQEYCEKKGEQLSFVGLRPESFSAFAGDIFTGILRTLVDNSTKMHTIELRYGHFDGDSFVEEEFPTTSEAIDLAKVFYMLRRSGTVIYATEYSSKAFYTLGMTNVIEASSFIIRFTMCLQKENHFVGKLLSELPGLYQAWITEEFGKISVKYEIISVKRGKIASPSVTNSLFYVLDTDGFLNPRGFIEQGTRRRFADCILNYNDRGLKQVTNALSVACLPGPYTRALERVPEEGVILSEDAAAMADVKTVFAQ